jgi:6-phosphogluconolactonase
MTTKVIPGMLIATISPEDVAREASQRVAKVLKETVAERGRAVLALSGGETPKAAYAKLADQALDWSKIDVLFVDERAVPPTSERSNFRMVKEALLDRAKIPADKVHRMPADAADLEQAAREYAQIVQRVAGRGVATPVIDALVLGVGDDGHTASLFPNDPAVDVIDRHVVAVAASGAREARLTLSAPVLEAAEHTFVLAVGAKKTPALEQVWAVSGSTRTTPARIVRNMRGSVLWLIDKAAGGMG